MLRLTLFIIIFILASCSSNKATEEKERTNASNAEIGKNMAIDEPPNQSLNSIQSSCSANYERLKKDYELFGRWIISNSQVNFNYIYEIYQSENQYVGISLHRNFNFSTEILSRNEDIFAIKGSDIYYEIDSKKRMAIHGLEPKSGYTASLLTEQDEVAMNIAKDILDSLYIPEPEIFNSHDEVREPSKRN